jgi:hypothetical protein
MQPFASVVSLIVISERTHGGIMNRFCLLTACVMAGIISTSVDAQDRASRVGRRTVMPRADEVALARSAAPASVSSGATVLVFADTGFIVAESGSNNVTCIVNRSWPASLEPHCFDSESAETILPIEIARTMLYHRGRSESEADREIADGLASGRFRLPRRPAMSYMMSEGQVLVDDDGKTVGRWRPHIMIYYPYLKSSDVGFGSTPDMKIGMVSESGRATSNLMIVMPQFVAVAAKQP